jgi:hypothetical protein
MKHPLGTLPPAALQGRIQQMLPALREPLAQARKRPGAGMAGH